MGGEPADAGSTIVMYLYKNGFQFMRLGYASNNRMGAVFHYCCDLNRTIKNYSVSSEMNSSRHAPLCRQQ